MTCVSGFWPVKNKHRDYTKWFGNSLRINCPYLFFCAKETIPVIQKYRGDLPTMYIEFYLQEFETWKYKDLMKTHPVHCPSAEINLIWNEKIFLLKRAADLNAFQTDFFCWVDAGICVYREQPPPSTPFPNPEKAATLPQNKFIFSSSQPYNEYRVTKYNYYHHISGTSFVLHKNIIGDFALLYKGYLDKLLDGKNIWTDQIVLTHIFKAHPTLFFELCTGYGEIIPTLY